MAILFSLTSTARAWCRMRFTGSHSGRVFLLGVIVLMGACSNQQMYEALQQSEQQECQKNHPHARERCLRQVSQPYEEFRADREDLIRENTVPADTEEESTGEVES